MASGKFSALYEGTGEEPPIAPAAPLAGKDAGPAARRAAAGMPPGPRDLTAEQAGTSNAPRKLVADEAGPIRIVPVGASGQPSIDELGPAEQAQAKAEAERNLGFVAGTIIGAPAGAVGGRLAGAAAGKVAPKLVPLASGFGAGSAATAATGGTPLEIVKGGAFGAAFNLPAALEGIGTIMSKPSRDLGIVKDLTPYMDVETRQQARNIGYAKVAETSRRYGVVGAPDPATANASVKAGSTSVGREIGDVYASIGDEYARPTGQFLQAVNRDAASLRTTRAGRDMADAMMEEAKRIVEINGGNTKFSGIDAGKMTLRTIRKELSDSQAEGYGSKRYEMLDDSSRAELQRRISRHLQAELDAGLAAAGADPRFSSKVARIPELNATYRALQVLDETTGRMVDRAMTRQDPSFITRSSNAIHKGTFGALGKPMPEKYLPVKTPTGRRAGMGMTPGEPLDPALTGALVNAQQDPDGIKASLRNIFFGGGGDQ